jgi:hypothetical protein
VTGTETVTVETTVVGLHWAEAGSMAAVSLIDTLPYGGGTLPGAVKAAAMPNGIAARAATSFLTFMSWASGVVLWWEAVEKGKEWLRVNGWWRD